MKIKIIVFLFILVAVAYMAGRNHGFKAGFQDGWAAAEKESTVEWGEWR